MMLLSSAITCQISLSNLHFSHCHHKLHTSSTHKPPTSSITASSSSSLQNPNPNSLLRHVSSNTTLDEGEQQQQQQQTVSSASAVSSAIRNASISPVEFIQKFEKESRNQSLVLPSPDFRRLCVEQLDLFRRIVHSDAIISVYVRPAGSYVMDRLELRRVTVYPQGTNDSDIVILIGNFSIPTGLRAAEAALSNQQAEVVPECKAVVFPMVKHPFVVGFLVAELPKLELGTKEQDISHWTSPVESYDLSSLSCSDSKFHGIQPLWDEMPNVHQLTAEQRCNAINISRSLAMAYVMDQKAKLLQQSAWQNNVRMSNLVEQIRGPLSNIRALSKMLSVHMKRSEISYDIVEDILVQGDRMRDTLQQLQDAVYLTKANIVRYNEETLKKMPNSALSHLDSVRSQFSNYNPEQISKSEVQHSGESVNLNSAVKDVAMPMPPLALVPLQHSVRPCSVSDVLEDLVGAAAPLACKQQRSIILSELSESVDVAIEEPALRQALSNLIEGALLRTRIGGKVQIMSTMAPAGGMLVVIDDDGPDMHYMTQLHSLTPFGADLFSENMVEDNMTWNFVAGLTVAREILESYGCVVRVISPQTTDAALGAGGTRVELWLPSFVASSDLSPSQEA
ncbi:hypothetical protein RJ641_002739 [Dillenia turbinata]|uniref:Histidine kinase domain-containing protein n=1 Tax=Dillenia turbinata TaxID=194707 RepID=A0AAN8ZAF3_9MAGN